MRSIYFILVAIVIAIFDISAASACSFGYPDPEVVKKEADVILVGTVVSERWPERIESDLSKPWGKHIVRVEFTKALRGSLSASREFEVPCGAPFPSLNWRVFAVYGRWGESLVPSDAPEYEKTLATVTTKKP